MYAAPVPRERLGNILSELAPVSVLAVVRPRASVSPWLPGDKKQTGVRQPGSFAVPPRLTSSLSRKSKPGLSCLCGS